MQNTIQKILRKIQYIEADIEIQKQILHSTPGQDETEIRNVIQKIADSKEEIKRLRLDIEQLSPQEHQRIQALENAVATFSTFIAENSFTIVDSMSTNPNCNLTCQTGEICPCLVKASDKSGNWVIITPEGEIRRFTNQELIDPT
jgi:hypothetical protein